MRYRFMFLSLALFCAACGPDYGRIANKLREQNLEYEKQLEKSQLQIRGLQTANRQLQDQLDNKIPRIASLPDERLEQLFTVGRIAIRKSTDAYDFDNNGVLEGFRVFVQTQTDDGTVLPATGTLTIDAFDLTKPDGSQRLAHCEFSPEELKKNWYGIFGFHHFALNCPWTSPPSQPNITFRVAFTDALTGRLFEDQQLIKVHLDKPTAPATSPAMNHR